MCVAGGRHRSFLFVISLQPVTLSLQPERVPGRAQRRRDDGEQPECCRKGLAFGVDFFFFGGDPGSSTASVQVALLPERGGEISRWPLPSWARIRVSILTPPLLRGHREQPPASPSGWELGGLGAFAGFLAFLLWFCTFSSPLSVTRGLAAAPRWLLLPVSTSHRFLLPLKSSSGAFSGGFRVLGMGSFPRDPFLRIGQRAECRVRPCHPLPLPVPSGSQLWGPAWQPVGWWWLPGGQGDDAPAGRPPRLHWPTASGSAFLGGRWPHGGEDCREGGKPPAALMLAAGRSPPTSAPRGACVACGGAAARLRWWEAAVAPLCVASLMHPPLKSPSPRAGV